MGEAALGPSIHLVTSVASFLALGLLAGPDTPAGRPLARLLAENRTLGLIATTANWDFFPRVFAGMDHQHAPQSVWVRVERSASCLVCGSAPAPPLNEQAGAQLADVIASVREQVRDEDADVTEAALQVAGPENPKRVMRSLLGQLVHAVVVFGRMCHRMNARTRNRDD